MPRSKESRRVIYVPCAAINLDGAACGNKVPAFATGVYVRGSRCRVHGKVSLTGRDAHNQDPKNEGAP